MSLVHGLDDAALCIRHAMRIHDMNGYSNSYDDCFAITYIRPLFIMEEVNYLLHANSRHLERIGEVKIGVRPRSYKDVLKARVNTNDSNEHSLNREETKSEAKAEFVGANKENKKETERLLEMARQMGKQDEDNGVGPLKGWMECSAQLVEAENDWLNSSAVGRPKVDFSNEEIQRSLQAKGVSDLNNIDSADNKSSTKKRNNGENGLMAPSMAEETQMVAGCNGSSWKVNSPQRKSSE
ncbi:hypothetical protein QQP08_014988 [Theobroma cacao]|nr:hypothetical protein QQP08_014988 [Theobroma cacao]